MPDSMLHTKGSARMRPVPTLKEFMAGAGNREPEPDHHNACGYCYNREKNTLL